MQGRRSTALLLSIALLSVAADGAAQQRGEFQGHLSPTPANAPESITRQGTGHVTASLNESNLTLRVTFEGLTTPAIGAEVRRAVPGLRGPVVFPLTVKQVRSGTIDATLTLTPSQVDDLNRQWYYVQIATENNPDGHIRGWLLSKESP